MVERPIKKSERQVKADANGVGANFEPDPNSVGDKLEQGLKIGAQPSEDRPTKQDRDSSRKGKRSRQKTEEPSRGNPALLRGPRPSKPKPSATQAEEVSPTEPSASSDEIPT